MTLDHAILKARQRELLYQLVWRRYSASIRLLIDNHYMFQPFWDHMNDSGAASDWQDQFQRSKRAAHKALGAMETKKVFAITFDRLYTLRNQLVYGGSTWNSSVNRNQIVDGARILGDVVPLIIHLMMENPHQLWGDPCYPVVK